MLTLGYRIIDWSRVASLTAGVLRLRYCAQCLVEHLDHKDLKVIGQDSFQVTLASQVEAIAELQTLPKSQSASPFYCWRRCLILCHERVPCHSLSVKRCSVLPEGFQSAREMHEPGLQTVCLGSAIQSHKSWRPTNGSQMQQLLALVHDKSSSFQYEGVPSAIVPSLSCAPASALFD